MDAVNVDKAVEFILTCMNFDGGFGVAPGSESHAGQVQIELKYRITVLYLVNTISYYNIYRYIVVLVH